MSSQMSWVPSLMIGKVSLKPWATRQKEDLLLLLNRRFDVDGQKSVVSFFDILKSSAIRETLF